MAAVFHFYDSEEEDEDEDEGPAPVHHHYTSGLGTTITLSQKRSQSRTTQSSKQTLEKLVLLKKFEIYHLWQLKYICTGYNLLQSE